MANKSPKLLSRNSLFFSTQNVILTVVCVFPERDIFKGYNTDWMVAILKWGVCKENLCLSLEELTVKRHSYLGGFVPSHIELQEMVLKYTHFSVGNLGELTCISHVSSAGKGHCGFPSPLWTARLWIELCSRVWRVQALVFRRGVVGKSPGWRWGWSVSLGLQTMASY